MSEDHRFRVGGAGTTGVALVNAAATQGTADGRMVARPSALGRFQASGRAYAFMLLVLLLVSEIKLRQRDSELALEASVDGQVLFELVVWAAVGCWVILRLTGADRIVWTSFPSRVGPALRVYVLIAALAVILSVYSLSLLSMVRAGQLAVLCGVALLLDHDLSTGRVTIEAVWLWFRRGMWGLVIMLTLVVAAIPSLTPMKATMGLGRYHWFSTHEITTGVVIGIALVLLAGSALAFPDPWLDRGIGPAMRLLMMGGFGVLLLATRSRTPLFATVAALLLMAVLARSRRRRSETILLIGAILLILSGVGVEQLADSVSRGQSAEQIASLTGRDAIYRAAWQLFTEQPLIGHGYQSGRFIFLQRIPWAPGNSHSALVDIAISMGVVGLLAYLWLFVRLGMSFRTLFRRRTMTAENLWAREVAPLAVMLLLMGVTVNGFSGAVGAQPILFAFAVLAADAWWRSTRRAQPRIGGQQQQQVLTRVGELGPRPAHVSTTSTR